VTPAIRNAAQHLLGYPFRIWGFGEGIGVRALLATGDPLHEGFVRGLFASWLGRGGPRTSEDHVAPGSELLALHERSGERALLDAARRLALLLTSLPELEGVRLHRADQPGFKRQIWVDCVHVDGPFLARFARVSGRHEYFDEAARQLLTYARLLQEPSGLFRHGWEGACGPNGQLWARGNGWALTGLLDTAAELPPEHGAIPEIRQRIDTLLRALERHQAPDGLWHTLIDDQSTYRETTLAAMLGYALHGRAGSFERMRSAAETAVLQNVSPAGELALTSEATPVAERHMYATRPFGVYPWGQGPLILLYCALAKNDENRQS
jgi:unsaturated rhamnogalacturonyl hydrolase